MEQVEGMRPAEAEEYIAALYGDELYGLELEGEMSGEGAMRCGRSSVHDQVRGICKRLGLDYARIDRAAKERAGSSGRARSCRAGLMPILRSGPSPVACAPRGRAALPVRKVLARAAGPIIRPR